MWPCARVPRVCVCERALCDAIPNICLETTHKRATRRVKRSIPLTSSINSNRFHGQTPDKHTDSNSRGRIRHTDTLSHTHIERERRSDRVVLARQSRLSTYIGFVRGTCFWPYFWPINANPIENEITISRELCTCERVCNFNLNGRCCRCSISSDDKNSTNHMDSVWH